MADEPTLSFTLNITATGNLGDAEACAKAVVTATRILQPLFQVGAPTTVEGPALEMVAPASTEK